MNNIAFLLARLAIAGSMFGHGLVRLPKLQTFSEGMVADFKDAALPISLVSAFSYIIPIAEFVIGLLLLLGLFTRVALIAGGILMLFLIMGTSAIENWGALPSQLIHVAFFAVLLNHVQSNYLAVDNLLNKG
ncbi:DoxX family membrane protein [Olivibacter sp. SDN3]|uniref:DoxX family membrane protein n=1 Tax=Olivibacter sp. SDN3 TaxID=2764720 RepID=UPI001651693A|nr:DoxX family membrane protein [Olivibacter sp. SDN3]QNL48664.1 DoxX family membrane protein [Olivibacter sp. SDN3]